MAHERDPYQDYISNPEIVAELRLVNEKLEAIDTNLHAGFTTLAGYLRSIDERLELGFQRLERALVHPSIREHLDETTGGGRAKT